MTIYDIKINHVHEPLGFMYTDVPVLGYKVKDAVGCYQKNVCIKVSDRKDMKNCLYDSGELTEAKTVYPLRFSLSPRTRYYVSIAAQSDAGEIEMVETWFETGKFGESWRADWISSAYDEDNSVPTLGKHFNIDKEVEQARLYVGCCGLYSLSLNGKKVGNEYLTPYCNNYTDWMQIIAHDMTSLLCEGDNVLEATLSDGWYKGSFTFERRENIYGDTLALIAELHIRYADGCEQIISTDDSWFSHKSVYRSAGIYDGVELDFCRFHDDEHPVRILDLDKSILKDRLSLPVIVKETVVATNCFTTPKGEKCLDMGQNMVGWLRIDTTAFADKDLSIRFFEVLDPEGNVYTDNLRTAKQAFTYKTDGNSRIIEPEFTFYGFRYACIEGLDNLYTDAFTGCVVYSNLDISGYIETSNPLVNRLFQNVLWGQKGNFVDVPTDCPQRDERMGWTGDAQVFCATAHFNMDSTAFFHKYVHDIQQEQKHSDGGVPHFVPSFEVLKDAGIFAGSSAAWGDAATVIPWTTYLFSGDSCLLRRQYPVMKAWVEYIRKQDQGNFLWDTGFHFGDWLALDAPRPERPFGTTPSIMVASAYYLYSVTLIAKAAKVLGMPDDVKEYTQLAKNIRTAMQKEFVTPSGRIASDTQTANIIALFMDFATDRHKTAMMLDEKVKNNDGHLNTGFVGTAYICRVLSDNGYGDTAYQLLLKREYPSWLYTVEKGATTIWERWNSIKPDGSLGDVSMNSYNHYAYGAVAEWIYRNVAGMRPTAEGAGFKKIRLTPQPNRRLEWMKASYESASGLYRSEWRIKKGGLSFEFEIPFGGEAELCLPDAPNEICVNKQRIDYAKGMKLGKGVYEIEYQPTTPYFMTYGIDSLLSDVMAKDELVKWLNENVVELGKLGPLVSLYPFDGSLGDFLEAQNIAMDDDIKEKMLKDWATVRGWD